MAALQAGAALLILSLVLSRAMERRPGDPLWCVFARIGASGFAAWLMIGAGFAAVPPQSRLSVTVLSEAPGELLLEVRGFRRPGCTFKYNDGFVYDEFDAMHYAAIEYINGPGALNRPAGHHRFVDRLLTFDPKIKPEAVRFIAHHDCGALWRGVLSDSGRLGL